MSSDKVNGGNNEQLAEEMKESREMKELLIAQEQDHQKEIEKRDQLIVDLNKLFQQVEIK